MKQIIISYGKGLEPCDDFLVEEKFNQFLESSLSEYNTSSWLMILYIRTLVKDSIINYKNIIFYFDQSGEVTHEIKINKNGEFSDYPNGFGDLATTYYEKLI